MPQATPIQLLRSSVLNRRPDPVLLLPGQPAVNIHADQPGLFFRDSTGSSLFKVGPCAVGATAPNNNIALTKGEFWLDTSLSSSTLKVYNGSQWVQLAPSISPEFSGVVKISTGSAAAPSLTFSADASSNTGVYLAAENQIGIATDGVSRVVVKNDGVELKGSTSGGITLQAASVAGSNTVTFPAVTGDVVTTGDTGTVSNTMLADNSVTSGKILNGTIVDADVNSSANIASSKLLFTQGGTGAEPRTVESKLRELVSLLDFIPVAQHANILNGTTTYDATADIQDAVNYCNTNGLILTGEGTYIISSSITINCDCKLAGAVFRASATVLGTNPAIVLGDAVFTSISRRNYELPQLINTAKPSIGWSGIENSVGVLVRTMYESSISIPYVFGFGTGAIIGGVQAGFSYNNVTLGAFVNNRIGLLLKPQGINGWCNENNFYGGRFAITSEQGTQIAGTRYIQLARADGGVNGPPNNNVFYKPSIEGNGPQYHLDIQGAYNTFLNPRIEVPSGSGRIRFYSLTAGETQSNLFINGYKFDIDYTFEGADSPRNSWIGSRNDSSMGGTGSVLNISNDYSSNEIGPQLQGFYAGEPCINKNRFSTNWSYRLYAAGYSGKRPTDTNNRFRLDNANGRIFFGDGSTTEDTNLRLWTTGLGLNDDFLPQTDNTYSLGTSGYRWSQLFAASGTINTSDEAIKQDIESLEEAELRVANSLKGLIKKFRYKDAVAKKGEEARIHVGVIAQEVIAAFEKEGLDPFRYGIVCYDEWDEEPEELGEEGEIIKERKEAGSIYSIRYEELLAFIIASL